MTDILITAVTLPSGQVSDLAIRQGHLVEPASLTHPQVIPAEGLIVLPGLVDLHTHLREPSPEPAETITSGTRAGARGGFTATFAMANTDPVTDNPARVRDLLARARTASTEVIPVGAITQGLAGLALSEISAMHDTGVTYFSDDGRCVMDARLMRQALFQVGAFGGVIAQHSQDHNLAGPDACLPETSQTTPQTHLSHPGEATSWPWVAEAAIVARDIQLARDTGTHVHVCHVSTAESIDVLRWAKSRQIPVSAEATPHHLLLGTDQLVSQDTRFKVNPPLRPSEDSLELRRALADGTVDVVATDHAPHLPRDKDQPFPQAKPGMVGLEWALGVVIETMVTPGLLTWEGVANRMSHTPAQIGQISSRQGRPLAIGEPASFTLIDPHRRAIVNQDWAFTQGRNNPYHGLDLPDPVLATFWAGRVTYADPALSDAMN